jgi:signal transduction histidine kinase
VNRRSELSPERVLILTPTGRDATMVEERLGAAGFVCEPCDDVDALVSAMRSDAGAALIAQEALSPSGAEAMLAALDAQEPWSDVPVLLLTSSRSERAAQAHSTVGLLDRANVMLLQRPLPLHLLLSAVRSAVRARRRQYQMRDLHRELTRAMQLSDMFVGILGHDLRTPLGAIKMSAAVLVQGEGAAGALGPAARIMTSADRMARMIEQLLDLARVRQGPGIGTSFVSADLGAIARQVIQELRDGRPQASIDVLPTGDLVGRWDPDRLAQVVSNLVGNAIQHGSAGEPITVELDGTAPATVRLVVVSTGAIPEQWMPTLFEPFKRTAPSRARDKGLGLGLFIAREIVRAHGGEIAVRVADGRTIFEATLPRQAPAREPDIVAPA